MRALIFRISSRLDVRAGKVAHTDPRRQLRGEKCLMAARDFAPGECVGVYGMWVGTEVEFFVELSERMAAGDAEGARDMHRYAMSIEVCVCVCVCVWPRIVFSIISRLLCHSGTERGGSNVLRACACS